MSLEALTRKIIAEYSGLVEGDDGLPWAEHLIKAQEPQLGVEKATKELQDAEAPEGSPHIHDDSVGVSLIDGIQGGPSIPREVSGPLVSEPEGGDRSWEPVTHFNVPQRYTDDISTKNWWDSRERDDQSTGTAFGNESIGLPLEASVSMPMDTYFGIRKEAKTMSQILFDNKNHKKQVMDSRGDKLVQAYVAAIAQMPEEDKSKGLFLFQVSSPDSGEMHRTVLQFLGKEGGPAKKLLARDCLVGCDCDAFLYWGAQYYAVKGGYLHMDFFRPTLIAPKDYIPGVTKEISRGQHGTYCKHLYAAMHALSKTGVAEPTAVVDQIQHVKEPLYDAEKMFEVMQVDSYEDFKKAIESGAVPESLRTELRDLLSEHGLFREFQEWVGQWVSTGTTPQKLHFLEDMEQAPSVIMWVLIQDFRRKGYLPETYYKYAWKTISKLLDIGKAPEPAAPKPSEEAKVPEGTK